MNRKTGVRLFAFLMCLLLGTQFAVAIEPITAENGEFVAGEIDVPYQFPVVPGMDEWKSLKTFEEKLAVSQIPEDILTRMTTDALFKTVLNYPLAASLFVHDTIDDPYRSYEVVKEEFNGLAELDKRLSDQPQEVLEILAPVLQVSESKDMTAAVNFDQMYKQKLVDSMLHDDRLAVTSISDKIVEISTGDPEYTVVAYRNLTWADLRTTAEEEAELTRELLEEYPSTTLIRQETPKYNCHSYAWYSTASTNNYWIDDPSNFYNAGEYDSVSTPGFGDIILYGRINWNPSHSGKITGVSNGAVTRVQSKWGKSALFEHNYDDCPYSTRYLQYYE